MEQQIKMLNDMIAENPDSTVRDFLDLLRDVEAIENAPKISIPVRMQGRGLNAKFRPYVWISK